MRIVISLDTATPATNIALYARCGSDVATDSAGIVADAFTHPGGTQTLSVSRPLSGQSGTCYIAPYLTQSNGQTNARLLVDVQPFPAGNRITVPATAAIPLAGQPDGTNYGSLTSPSDSPPQVNISLTPGQVLHVVAAGQIMYQGAAASTPDGLGDGSTGYGNGIASLNAPNAGLIGVFLGASINPNLPPSLDFNGGLRDSSTITPLLQQPFYIGSGYTPDGTLKSFVVPTGATRFYLGTGDPFPNSTGSYVAAVNAGIVPGSNQPSNPLTVPAIAAIPLAGQPDGTNYGSLTSPSDSPPQVNISLTPGQVLHVVAAGQIMYQGAAASTPDGLGDGSTGYGNGIASLNAPNAGLIGVFLGASIDPNLPPSLDFNGGSRDSSTITPLLQQPFYIGSGYTPDGTLKSFVVPTGATRFYLGTGGPFPNSTGSYVATASPGLATVPQITPIGILNGAGFGPAPLTAGGLVSVYGSNFGALMSAQAVPLPTILANTRVFFNDIAAPLFFVSPNQINAQVPIQLRGQTSALVTVTNNGIAGVPVNLPLTPFSPGIFTASPSSPVIIDYQTGQLVDLSNSVHRGDTLIIYASGLGLTLLDSASGNPAPADQLSPALLPIQITFQGAEGQITLTPAFAGLAPGFIGVDQINVQIPPDAPIGAIQLDIQSGSLGTSQRVMLSIQ